MTRLKMARLKLHPQTSPSSSSSEEDSQYTKDLQMIIESGMTRLVVGVWLQNILTPRYAAVESRLFYR